MTVSSASPVRLSSPRLINCSSSLGVVFLAAVSLVPLACRSDDSPRTENVPDEVGENVPDVPDSPLSSEDADQLFSSKSIPTFRLTLPEDEWEALKKNAVDEEYVEAELSFEDEKMGTVGLRFKGGFGSLFACVDEEGNLLCPKLSMKLKFDKYVSDKRFYGMKRLNLHSMVRDDTKMHDKISYGLYRDSGVIAPRSHWAQLEVNGESMGLYATVEAIDGRFTADRWPEDKDGNLYKEVWPQYDNSEAYQNALETNEEEATHERMLAFAGALEGASAEDALAALDTFSDSDQLYTYMAVQDATVNWDGVTAWYCSEWGCSNHNLYWYVEAESGKVTLIPWDLDSTLNPAAPMGHVPHWTVTPDDCTERYSVFADTEVMAPGCSPFFQGLASDYDRYSAAIQKLLDGPFQLVKLRSDIDSYAELLREAVGADATMQSVAGWEEDVSKLKTDLALLQERLEALRDRKAIFAFGIVPSQANDFEAVASLGLTLGTVLYAAPNTSASHQLNTNSPATGAQDLRLDYTFRDEPTGTWNQWAALTLLMDGGVQDLSAFTGLRFDLLAEATREVRVDLDSVLETKRNDGIRPGWSVQATSEVQTIEVQFADLAVPVWADDPGDDLALIVESISGLILQPQVLGRSDQGLLGADVEDVGFIQIDNIQFY